MKGLCGVSSVASLVAEISAVKFDLLMSLEQTSKISRAEESGREEVASLTMKPRRMQMEDVRENFTSMRKSLKDKY